PLCRSLSFSDEPAPAQLHPLSLQTLFRSRPEHPVGARALGMHHPLRDALAIEVGQLLEQPDVLQQDRAAPTGRHRVLVVEKLAQDRKSTRLNSSHVKISYAVFCLKKKTQK